MRAAIGRTPQQPPGARSCATAMDAAMALRKIELGPERKFVIDSRARLLDVLCLIAIAAAPLVVLLLLVPLPLVLPILSVLSFVLAWGVALYALFTKASRETRDITVWDFAAAFT